MTYEIHAGPMPVRNGAKYPFLDLQPGEWFKVTCSPKLRRKLQVNLSSQGRRWARIGGMKFRTMCFADGVGVQRVT